MGNPIIFPKLGIEIDPGQGFSIGPLNVRFYGLVIAVGLLLAVIYGMRRCKHFGLKQDDLLDGVLWIVPFAIVCARIYYCAFSWESYADDPIRVLYIWEGGIAIYGGVIGAVLGILVFCRIKKISVGAVLDLVLLGFLIGQAIGRWGNFFNREAFGCYTDNLFAMQIHAGNLPQSTLQAMGADVTQLLQMAKDGGYAPMIQVHPTFFYEFAWNAVGFVLLHYWSKKRRYDGQIALGYAAWYGLGRVWIEGLRMDSLYWGPFRVSQLLAGATCVIAIAVLVFLHFRPHKPLFVNRVTEQEQPEEEAEQPEEEQNENDNT